MCGRFVMLTREEVAEVVSAVQRGERPRMFGGAAGAGGRPGATASNGPDASATMRVQAFPGSIVPTIGYPSELSPKVSRSFDALAVSDLTWGFAPEWSKRPIFNTRIESALSGTGMWRELIRDGRCIIPAATFFEPHQSETMRSRRTGRQVKRPYRFNDPTGMPLLLAGVRDDERCSVVTTEPNRWVSPVHDRMPLLLRFEEVPLWLEGGLSDLAALADRTSVELVVRPEFDKEAGDAPSDSDDAQGGIDRGQLSLF